MSDKIIGTNDQLQASTELARKNVARLKTQIPLPPVKWSQHHGGAGARARRLEQRPRLGAKDQATLTHTLGGVGAFKISRVN